jgi:hypothetical protein
VSRVEEKSSVMQKSCEKKTQIEKFAHTELKKKQKVIKKVTWSHGHPLDEFLNATTRITKSMI